MLLTKPERHSQHQCHIVSVCLATIVATSFKRIMCWTQLPLRISVVGNAALWAVNCTVLSSRHGVRRTLQASGPLDNINSTAAESTLPVGTKVMMGCPIFVFWCRSKFIWYQYYMIRWSVCVCGGGGMSLWSSRHWSICHNVSLLCQRIVISGAEEWSCHQVSL
jgi:hypothetical protein